MSIFYKPVIVKKEYNNEHYYFVDDVFFPSVTKILGETLPMPMAVKMWIGDLGNEKAQQKLEMAGERGTALHDACARLLNNEAVKLAEEFPEIKDKKALVGFVNWFNDYQPQPLKEHSASSEIIVASKLGFAGTLDYVCLIKSKPYIIDFKTSRGIYDSHKLQVTSYKRAFWENTGISCKRGLLHLNPLNKKGYTFYDDDQIKIHDRNVRIYDFMMVFKMYKMLNGGKVPPPPVLDAYPEVLELKKYDQLATEGTTGKE